MVCAKTFVVIEYFMEKVRMRRKGVDVFHTAGEKMGVSIAQYRAKIGTFIQHGGSKRQKCIVQGIRIDGGSFSVCLRLSIVLCALLVTCGSVEVNPGPGPGPATRQQTLTADKEGTIGIDANTEVMKMLRDIKSEIKGMNRNFETLNGKVDNMASEFNKQLENLRYENRELSMRLKVMEDKIDDLESRSRRDNLIFHGLPGSTGESWEQSEENVRDFMVDTLGMNSDMVKDIIITRSHRLNPRNPQSPVIAKFVKNSDRSAVLKRARETLDRSGNQRVTEDFTRRVREERRALSRWFVQARDQNKRVKIIFSV